MGRILDIGCGTDRIPGAVRLDMNPAVNPDILFEITKGAEIPVASSSFDEIYLRDILEHVDNVPWLLSEIHRIGAQNALVNVRYPHFSSTNNYGDVTHCRQLNLRCLEHFDPSTEYGAKYKYYGFFGKNFPFKIEICRANFPESPTGKISRAIYNFVGSLRYEQRFAKLLQIENIEVEMRVQKE
jgi:ubiquinone/menaquinone biosynthesis C-methylase UbiE